MKNMKSENLIDNRIVWVDIYKTIAIILVVVGHATGRFSSYIYQFHVAAFFFISGYVSHMDRSTFGRNLIKRFLNLIIPLGTSVILFGIILRL